jgi:pimeloyl-ACP methyl ester carboxylesterase
MFALVALLVASVAAQSDPKAQWFTQLLDHFNPQDSRTWLQKFYVNDTFFVPGGPIFFQVGGEGPIAYYDVTSWQMSVFANQYNALQITLEHRFYGDSHPLPDLSTPNLRYLTIEQALADAADFTAFIKSQYPTASKVVAFGGSYPGNLAAWLRIKYPTVIDLAIASSAPVQIVEDMVSYLEVVGRSLALIGGQACDAAIRTATTQISQMIQSAAGAAQLSQTFNTCQPLATVQNDWLQAATFSQDLMGNFMSTVQYNRYGFHGSPFNVSVLCNMMENQANTPLENYAAVSNFFLSLGNQTCLDTSYKNSVAGLMNLTDFGGGRSWTYQTCTQTGYFQTTDAPTQPFGDLVPLKYYTQLCVDAFGLNMTGLPRVDEVNRAYGGNDVVGATRIMFINCNWDEWASLSIVKSESPSLLSLVIRDGAHCCDMHQNPLNPHAVAAHKTISIQLGKWLRAAAE